MGKWRIYDKYGNYKGQLDDGSYNNYGGPSSKLIFALKAIAFFGLLLIFGKAGLLKEWYNLSTLRPSLSTFDDPAYVNGFSWIKEAWKTGGFSGKFEAFQNVLAIALPILTGFIFGIKFHKDHYSTIGSVLFGVLWLFIVMAGCAALFALFNIGPNGYINTALLYLLCYFWNIFVVSLVPILLIVVIQAMSRVFEGIASFLGIFF